MQEVAYCPFDRVPTHARWHPGHRRFAVVASSVMLSACASFGGPQRLTLEVPPLAGAGGDTTAALPETDAFLAIDDGMRQLVDAQLKPVVDPVDRLRRLSAMLLGPEGLGIGYDGGLTLTAREAFQNRAGNCLSFTALLVVLAREAGLAARFQDVPVLPKWRVSGTTFIVERHVNALVRVGSRDFVIDFRPPEAATYSRVRVIDDANAVAQYFGNLGVDRFTAGDLAGAYQLYRRGLQVDPRAAALWLNIGVVFGRNRQWPEAELAYRNTLILDPGNLSALNNLALLLQQRGDVASARRLSARVESYRRKNPYYLYWLGEKHLQAGALHEALTSFGAALRFLPDEADFHFAMARTYRALGRAKDAERSLQAALERAPSASIRERYVREYRQP